MRARPEGVLFAGGVLMWLAHVYIWCDYSLTRSSAPDAAAGRVAALNTHGHFVYLTKHEQWTLWSLAALSLVLVATGVVMDIRRKTRSEKAATPLEKAKGEVEKFVERERERAKRL